MQNRNFNEILSTFCSTLSVQSVGSSNYCLELFCTKIKLMLRFHYFSFFPLQDPTFIFSFEKVLVAILTHFRPIFSNFERNLESRWKIP